MQTSNTIVLASMSPRRKEILENLNIPFTIHPSSFEEKSAGLPPMQLAIFNAEGKAQQVAKVYDDALVIGVDTVVAVGDELLGKPKNPQDHKRMISLISGTKHKVISAICIVDCKSGRKLSEYETTFVEMDDMTSQEITSYVASGEGDDKASGYAIQGLGSLYIKGIEGDYFNVVGLPVFRLRQMLKEFAVEMTI